MFYIIKYLVGLVQNAYEQHKDPRVEHLPLVGSPWPMAATIVVYLAFVLHYGPKWMENRKPFNLKHILRFYNAIQVIANLVLFVDGTSNSYLRKDFSLTCQPIDHTNTEPWMLKLIHLSYGYYITKYLDLLDTVFFVLRKKNNQITFLHVYHHAGMVFGVYIFMTFMAGSHCTMLGVINLFIHTVMYSYYFVTSLRPVKQALWWKRHITQLQLMQFGYLMLHFFMAIVRNHCHYPLSVSFVGLMQNLFMFALFFDFYYKAYMRRPSAQAQLLLAESKTVQQCKLPSKELSTATTLPNGVTQQQQQQKHEPTEKLIECLRSNSNSSSNNHIYNSSTSNKSNNNSNSSANPTLLKTKCG